MTTWQEVNRPKRPERRYVSGKLELSIWPHTQVLADGSTKQVKRVCLRHKQRNWRSGKREQQRIWFSFAGLTDLKRIVDKVSIELLLDASGE